MSGRRRDLGSLFLFDDRRHAGAVLAGALEPEARGDAVVVGLARGGIVVAAVVARALGLPLEFVAVRKVRHPLQPQYALGAVAPGGQAYVRARDGLTDNEFEAAVAAAGAEAEALDRTLRDGRPQASLAGRTVLLVDDGLATGATMIAAARWATGCGARRVVAAAPVGARETVDLLRRVSGEVVCPYPVDNLVAVGLWYADFAQVNDEDVAEILGTDGATALLGETRRPAGSAR
ncbi:MAG: phosphoribosyltransferase [Gaiellaceae bacterium]